jgi:hypothetical protein
MKRYLLLLLVLILDGCGSDPSTLRQHLGGYWQIEKVVMPGGEERSFKLNPLVDYIEVSGDSGIRKKVVPQLDGSFKVNESAETFTLEVVNDSLKMHYRTPFDRWSETVVKADDSILEVINRDQKRYYYKKFSTFSVD